MKNSVETMDRYVAAAVALQKELHMATLNLTPLNLPLCYQLLGHLLAFEWALNIPEAERVSVGLAGVLHLNSPKEPQ